MIIFFFFFNDTATTEIYTLSLHDALPIWPRFEPRLRPARRRAQAQREGGLVAGDRHRSRRRRRPRRGGHHASAGGGGLRPPGRFHGPPRRLQKPQATLPARPGRGHALDPARRRAPPRA